MIGEGEVSKVLRSRGVFVNRSWVEQAVAYLRNRGGLGSSAEAIAEKVFGLYLQSDIYDSCDYANDALGGQRQSQGLLPPDLHSKHAETVAQNQAIILQVDEVTNIGSSLDQQMQEGSRYLKLFLTDGINSVVGLEHRRINEVRLNMPAGTKVCVKNVPVRHGAFMLSPSSLKVLGGEVGRLTELAKLYAPPAEEAQPHILDERQPVAQPAREPGNPRQQQQHVPQGQPRQQQQQQPRQPLEAREPPPPAPAPSASHSVMTHRAIKPAPVVMTEVDRDDAEAESFLYPDAIELLGDSQDSENLPAQNPPSVGSPQVYDLTNSGPSSGVKESPISLDKDEPMTMSVENDSVMEVVPYPAAGGTEEDDLLGTPPRPDAMNTAIGAPSVLAAPLPVISPLSRLAEEGEASQEDREVFIRGHGTSMEKFKVRKAKGAGKSQSPVKGQGDAPEFEVYLHFDDGSTVYKMLRVHPALCEAQIGCSARAYQDALEKLDAKGAAEYKRATQMKFAAFRGIYRCEWKKSRKRKKSGGVGTPEPLELEAMEEVTDNTAVVRALTHAGMKRGPV